MSKYDVIKGGWEKYDPMKKDKTASKAVKKDSGRTAKKAKKK